MSLKRYQFALIPGGVIFGAVLFLLLFLPGQIKEISKELKRIKGEEKEIAELKEKYLLVSSLDQEVLASQALSVVAALPEDKNVPYVLQGLRKAVGNAGFVIQELKFSPGEIKKPEGQEAASKKKLVEGLPLSVKLMGRFDNLLSFLEKIEETLPLFQVMKVEAFRSKGGGFSGRAEISLVTFYSPPKRSEGKKISLEDLVLTEEETALLDQLPTYEVAVIERERKGPRRDPNENPFEL